jgi:hypothetical protein
MTRRVTSTFPRWPDLDPLSTDSRRAWERLVDLTSSTPPPCRSDAGELWFSPHRAHRAAAAECCSACQALDACGSYANVAGERFGVWAGVDRSPRQRRVRSTVDDDGSY